MVALCCIKTSSWTKDHLFGKHLPHLHYPKEKGKNCIWWSKACVANSTLIKISAGGMPAGQVGGRGSTSARGSWWQLWNCREWNVGPWPSVAAASPNPKLQVPINKISQSLGRSKGLQNYLNVGCQRKTPGLLMILSILLIWRHNCLQLEELARDVYNLSTAPSVHVYL
jgi:hypothetical protein